MSDEDENERSMRELFERMSAEREIERRQPDFTEGWNCSPTDDAIAHETERLMQAYREVLYRRLGHDHKHHGPAIPGKKYCYESLPGSFQACERARKKAERLRPLFYDMARSLVDQEEEDRDIALAEDGKPPAFPAPTQRPSKKRC